MNQTPQENRVSSCCGYPLVLVNGEESTAHYNCNKCGLPCDGVSDCADCFPQNFTHKLANQTVPICEKHYSEQIAKQPPEDEISLSIPIERNNQDPLMEIYDILININPPPVINRADYIHYGNRCYTASQKILKLLAKNKSTPSPAMGGDY